MSDSDLVKLYSGRILALAADIPHLGRLAAPSGTSRRRSPLCGSTGTVDLVMRDGRVADFAQDVKACALGQASASVLGAVVLGRSRVELESARDALVNGRWDAIGDLIDGIPSVQATAAKLPYMAAA